jgi:hypothetical protein
VLLAARIRLYCSAQFCPPYLLTEVADKPFNGRTRFPLLSADIPKRKFDTMITLTEIAAVLLHTDPGRQRR